MSAILTLAWPWWAWIVVAGVLALAEMVVPGAYLIWIALGAAATGIAAAGTGMVFEVQLATLATTTAVSCIAGYFVYRRVELDRNGGVPPNTPRRSMVGARGTVAEAFANGRGKVRVGDTVWLAEGPDLAVESPVVVAGVRGTRLEVTDPLDTGAASSKPAASGV